MAAPSRLTAATAVVLLGLAAACSGSDGDGDGDRSEAPPATTTTAPAVPRSTAAPLPVDRTEVAGALWEGRVAVVGGLTADGGANDRLDLYDPATDRWTAGPALPVAVHHAGVAALDGRLWVVGGYTNPPGGQWRVLADVWSLGPGERRWRREEPLPAPRGALALVAAGGGLVAVGGAGDQGATGRVETLAPGAGWTRGPDLREAREHLAAAVVDDRVYAIGGRRGGLAGNLRGVESWRRGEDAWRDEPSLGHGRGGIAAATTAGGRACVAGGEEDAGTIASVECLADRAWSVAASLAQPRHGLAVVAVGDRLHVVGGGPRPGLTVSGAHEVLTP